MQQRRRFLRSLWLALRVTMPPRKASINSVSADARRVQLLAEGPTLLRYPWHRRWRSARVDPCRSRPVRARVAPAALAATIASSRASIHRRSGLWIRYTGPRRSLGSPRRERTGSAKGLHRHPHRGRRRRQPAADAEPDGPEPTVDEVRKQVERLHEEPTGPTEEYSVIREKQLKLQGEADRAQDRLTRPSSRKSTNSGKARPGGFGRRCDASQAIRTPVRRAIVDGGRGGNRSDPGENGG